MKQQRIGLGISLAVALGIAVPALAQQAVQWRVEDGGNGHWYQVAEHPQTPGEPWGWYEALAWAGEHGGNLASIASSSENQFIFTNLANNVAYWRMGHSGTYSFGPWIGLSAVSGAWTWSDGSPFVYANWAPGEPYKGTWGYVHYYRYYQQGGTPMPDNRWDNTGPDRCVAAIIEWSADCNGDGIVDYGQCRDGSLPDYDGDNVPDCCEAGVPCTVGNYPVQWRVEDGGNGHWYRLMIFTSAIDWDTAKIYSESVGGQLASPVSESEDALLFALVTAGAWNSYYGPWLGGFQVAKSGEPSGIWEWIDGTIWSFTNWGPGQPDNGGPLAPPSLQEDRLHYIDHLRIWNDAPASGNGMVRSLLVEWSSDCNEDGIVDLGQILDGSLVDQDGDGVPDSCQAGEVRCWGANNNGQSDVPEDLGLVIGIDAGSAHTIALKRDGSVICWGAGTVSTGSAPHFGQSIVPTGLGSVKQVAAAGYHSKALRANGTLVCWGSDDYGESTIPAGVSLVRSIAAGFAHSVVLLADGTVRCWGRNNSGECN